MGKLKSVVGFCAIMLCLTASAQDNSEYYTWIDENGVVNYSERSPQGYDARFISSETRFGRQARAPRTLSSTPPVSQPEPASSPEEPLNLDQEMAEERARIAAELAPEREANCAIGKRNLAQLEAYARIRIKDEDGKPRVLTDEEKADRLRQAKQTIRDNCN